MGLLSFIAANKIIALAVALISLIIGVVLLSGTSVRDTARREVPAWKDNYKKTQEYRLK